MSLNLDNLVQTYKNNFEKIQQQNRQQEQEIEHVLSKLGNLHDFDTMLASEITTPPTQQISTKVPLSTHVNTEISFGTGEMKNPPSSSNTTSSSNPLSSSSAPSSDYPLSIKLESETLQKYRQKIPFRKYLELGYYNYHLWLVMTLGSNYAQHLNFCVARNMNSFKPYIMGKDLEIRYLIKKLENIFGPDQMKNYEHVMEKTLCENLSLSPSYAQSIIEQYLKNPRHFELMLSDEEFAKRLKSVGTVDLDLHSFQCWRNSNHVTLNNKPYPMSRMDILNGESLAPPSSKHIGLQTLQLHGFLPVITNIRRPQKYGATFV